MHVTTVKQIADVLSKSGVTNKEEQSSILGYIVGLEAPIGLQLNNPDDNIEWNSFFNDIPGEINEHYLLNLNHAQEVANLTLLYRQAVASGDNKIEDTAKKFLNLTGWAFGLLDKDGLVEELRELMKHTVAEKRQGVEERIAQRQAREVVEHEAEIEGDEE